MTIDTRAIPENESLVIEGQIIEDIWQISDTDIVKKIPSKPTILS